MPQESQSNNHTIESGVPGRIREMRALNTRPSGTGNYSAADPGLFYRQGCYMADFEDHTDRYVPLFDSQPSYESLNDDQLRCYFTWRAAIRRKRVTGTGVYYLYLYFFELINNIGVGSDALEQLAYAVNAYKNTFPDSIPLFKTWLRDYYVLNGTGGPFAECIRRLRLTDVFPIETYEQAFKYAYSLHIGGIVFENNRFTANSGFHKFVQCYCAIMNNLKTLFKMYGLDMENLFEGVYNADNSWFPYEQAIFYNASPVRDRIVRLNKFEQYSCVRGIWNRRLLSFDASVKALVDLIIEKMNAAVGPPQSNSPDKNMSALRNTPYMAVISDSYFDEIIRLTVAQCLQAPFSGELPPLSQDLFDLADSGVVKTIWQARSIPAALNSDKEISRQFVAQARVLAQCTDDYGAGAPPDITAAKYTFSMLSVPQTRLYLTWRTKYKKNEPVDAIPAFVNIYANELINKVYGESDWDVLEKLVGLMRYNPKLSEVFLDYYIAHNFSISFADVIERLEVSQYFPHIAIQGKHYKDWFTLFSDKLDFQPDPKIAPAFNFCIRGIREYFENAGLMFMALFLGIDGDQRGRWSVFSHAVYLFDNNGRKDDNSVSVSDYDSYAYSKTYRKWICLSASMINPKSYYLIGYIIKRLTALREGSKLPKIQAGRVKGIFPASSAYSKYIAALLSDSFNSVIDNAYGEYRQTERIKVRVDVSLLDGVRKAADENLEKLLIDYGNEAEQAENAAEASPPTAGTGWDAFLAALSDTRRSALTAVLDGKINELHKLARAENVLSEVLIESINDAALNYTGDYIIEETDKGPKILEEYEEALKGVNLCHG